MNNEKYISNIKEKVNKKIESLRSEANEAYNNWADTGYQRYMAKYERLLKEADELKRLSILRSKGVITQRKTENCEMKTKV